MNMKNDRIPAVIYFVSSALWAAASVRCFVSGKTVGGILWAIACAGCIGAGIFMIKRFSLSKKPAYVKVSGQGADDAFGEAVPQDLVPTPVLDFGSENIAALIDIKGWKSLGEDERISAVYDYVNSEFPFGFSSYDFVPASSVLKDGFGQPNTKTSLFMALLRGSGTKCRVHGYAADKSLYTSLLPQASYKVLPQSVLYEKAEVNGKEYEFLPEGIDKSLVLVSADLGVYDSPDDLSLANPQFAGKKSTPAAVGRHIANRKLHKPQEDDEKDDEEA